MKTKLIASALIALSVAASGSAFAQRGDDGNHRYDNHDRNGYTQQNNDRYDNDRHDNRRYESRHDSRHDSRYDDARRYQRDDYRGGGPRHDLRRGQRLSQ